MLNIYQSTVKFALIGYWAMKVLIILFINNEIVNLCNQTFIQQFSDYLRENMQLFKPEY